MRIVFPLLFAVAAFAFGQEQVIAEDSRELLAAWPGHRGHHRGFGFRHGGGPMAGPPAAEGGESDVAEADEANRLLLTMARGGRGGRGGSGRRGGGARGGGRRGGRRGGRGGGRRGGGRRGGGGGGRRGRFIL